jgi:hypothetical protein
MIEVGRDILHRLADRIPSSHFPSGLQDENRVLGVVIQERFEGFRNDQAVGFVNASEDRVGGHRGTSFNWAGWSVALAG